MRIALILSLCLASTPAATFAADIAITDATVINPRRNAVLPHTTVVIHDRTIVAVQPARQKLPPGVRRIDGRGKFLIPGLWDAHTHLSKTGSGSLTLFLAKGVTGVRDMGSNLAELLSWRRDIAQGRRPGPYIITSGPMLEAQANLERMARQATVEQVERQRIGVATPEEGRAAVRALAAAGVDQIKMRTAPDAATFAAVGEEAERLGLPFAAHPRGAVDEMIRARVDSAEHFLTFPPLDNLTQLERRAVFGRVAAAGLHVSNTSVNFRGLLMPYEQGRRILDNLPGHGDPYRKYLCGYLLRDWSEQLEESRDGGNKRLSAFLPSYYRDTREMYEGGVPLLAGTDAAVAFVYPGFSLHDQLQLMVSEIGLKPMDVLRIATTGVPAYLGKTDRMGGVEVGLQADLVLLDGDPLTMMSNTRRIRGVVAQGHWYGRARLNRMLSSVERDARARCEGGSLAGKP